MKIVAVRDNIPGKILVEFEGNKLAWVGTNPPRVIDCYRRASNGKHDVGDSVRARMVAKLRKAGYVQ